jgi:hypothetical protein
VKTARNRRPMIVRMLPVVALSRLTAECQLAATADWAVHAQRLFLGFVAFCLFAPLLQTLYPVFGKTTVSPIEERRAPNPFP